MRSHWLPEVIESKVKPSKPYGEICQDAFGDVPEFSDRGQMKRVILGIGLQDVLVAGLTPCLDVDILGASSDHVLIDARESDLKVGDEVEFNLNYGAFAVVNDIPLRRQILCRQPGPPRRRPAARDFTRV